MKVKKSSSRNYCPPQWSRTKTRYKDSSTKLPTEEHPMVSVDMQFSHHSCILTYPQPKVDSLYCVDIHTDTLFYFYIFSIMSRSFVILAKASGDSLLCAPSDTNVFK